MIVRQNVVVFVARQVARSSFVTRFDEAASGTGVDFAGAATGHHIASGFMIDERSVGDCETSIFVVLKIVFERRYDHI